MNGIIFCVCLTSAISVLPRRVTAKSKPMMNEVSRCSERTPDVLAFTAASESHRKTRHESQQPLSSWNEQQQRSGRLVLNAFSSDYSEWNADKNWSSQDWKSDELMEVRTGRLVHEQPPSLFTEHTDKFIVDDNDIDSDTDAESDMSLLSRSFLHRVSDRVRKIQDQSLQHATQDSNKHSLIWECLCLRHWKHLYSWVRNTQKFLHSIKNIGKDLTMKHMFDMSEKVDTQTI